MVRGDGQTTSRDQMRMTEVVMRLDSVEGKLTLSGDRVEAAVSALGLSAGGQDRKIYFCEDVTRQTSPDTPLLAARIILRARTWSDDKGDTTIKFRPGRQSQLTARWAKVGAADDKELKVEADWAGTSRVLAVSYSADRAAAIVEAVHHGDRPISDLLGNKQREFLDDCADTHVNLDGLTLLGPVRAVRWTSVPAERPGVGLNIRAERWTLSDLDFLELSIVSSPDEAGTRQHRLTAFIQSQGFPVEPEQRPKTTLVLRQLVEEHLAISA
jgi:hypothetical protein